MTFEEAYKKTGRVFCVTLSATSKKAPPVLINYITAPNVVIASAVVASASVPGFVNAMRLQVKNENGVVRYQAKCDEVSPMHVDNILIHGLLFLTLPWFLKQRLTEMVASTVISRQLVSQKCSIVDSLLPRRPTLTLYHSFTIAREM